MSRELPELEDYVRLFSVYGKDLGTIYTHEDNKQQGKSDPYAFLFEQLIKLLIKPSSFNLSLPKSFRIAAHRYHRGDKASLKHLQNVDNRNFLLCDLHDFIMLKGGLQLKRKVGKNDSSKS